MTNLRRNLKQLKFCNKKMYNSNLKNNYLDPVISTYKKYANLLWDFCITWV